ncbi:MAG: peptidylprolyl isomerase [Candidatus Obscuribacterales bacterium]|nr:peptidylprolyl isomerase [Candidatus Obscuribacterales bacterium]
MTNTDPVVLMETSKGPIKIRIYKSEVPTTADNFLGLVSQGFYNGLIFHRYEPGFCIQGGDPTGTGRGGSGKTIPLETKPHLKHDAAGVIAMARTNDPNSATSQFYFTLGNASFLDGEYAVFGRVEEGLDNVMQLRVGDKMLKVIVLEPAMT